MPSTATISIYCPPMAIYKINGKLHRTAAEPMIATMWFDDGTYQIISGVIIPPTLVNKVPLTVLTWKVQPCEGADAARQIVVTLPAELVVFDIMAATMVARAIPADVVLKRQDGIWKGVVIFPDCPTDLFSHPTQASAVTASGTLTRDTGPST